MKKKTDNNVYILKKLLYNYHRMKKKLFLFAFLIFSFPAHSLDFIDFSSAITDIFGGYSNDNEGTTSYRSLLIPVGGRCESLGCAYTGFCDDVAFFNYNPAASCIIKETQAGFFHNSWIADSNLETISYTTRMNNFAFGLQLSTFYIPFTEYNIMGERTAGSYYSENYFSLNASYNFLAGYEFKGFALGSNFKCAYRSVPDFSDNDTNEIISNSGLSQSGIALMFDFGLMLQFNFLKYFSSRDPNVKIGFAIENLGIGFTGIGSSFKVDDPLPTYIAAGMSVKFIPLVTAIIDIKQPVNLTALDKYQLFSLGAGVILDFTDIFNLLFGLELKSGNPKLSAGAEFEFKNTRFNVNYTLDLTSSLAPINRFSVSAKILMGDRGRAQVQHEIDVLYNEGLYYYYNSEWEKAIETWKKILEINKRYDPAIIGIQSAQSQIDMFENVRNSMFFEQESK